MKTSLKVSLKIFCRNAFYIIVSVISFCLLLLIPFLYPMERSPLFALDRSLQFNFIYFTLFAILSYELTSKVMDDVGTEAIKVIPSSRIKIALSNGILLFALLLIDCFFQGLAFSVRFAIDGIIELRFFTHVIIVQIVYALLPGIMGIAAGMAFSGENGTVSYCLIFLFSMIFSPITSRLSAKNTFISARRLDEWIRIFPGAELMWGDFLYGIPLETCRWILILFWIAVFLALRFLRKDYVSQKAGRLCLAVSCITMLILGIRFSFRSNDSIVDAVSPNGMLYSDSVFYSGWNRIEESADFEVSKYKMSFTFDDNLKASAVLIFDEKNADRKNYIFTLYHDLKVHSVQDESGKNLRFHRNGDWLDIETEEAVSSLKIVYSGRTGRHYANKQGVFLPGYFAYYPIPGHRNMWDDTRNRLLPITSCQMSKYEIAISDIKNTFCNLNKIEEGLLYGECTSLTIIRGFFSEKHTHDINLLYLPLMKGDVIYDKSSLQAAWNEKTELLNISSDITDQIHTVCLLPTVFMSNSNNERIVLLGDILLYAAMEPALDYNEIASKILMQNVKWSADRALLIQLFERALQGRIETEIYDKPAYEKLLPLVSASNQDGKLTGSAEKSFRDLFYYGWTTCNKRTFLSEIYEYLMTDPGSLHPVDFLYRLSE